MIKIYGVPIQLSVIRKYLIKIFGRRARPGQCPCELLLSATCHPSVEVSEPHPVVGMHDGV